MRAWGRPGGRGPPGTSAPTTNVPVAAMRPCRPRRGAGMRRLVGRDVLGAPRAGGRARCAQGDVHAARTGTFRGRGPPGTSAPTTNVPVTAMRPCRPGGGTGCAAGRARRPRRAARRGTRTLRARGRSCAHGDVPVDAGRRGRRPLPCDIKPTHGYSRNFHVSGEHRIVATFKGNLTLYQTFSHFIECPRHPSNPFSVFCGGEAVLCVLCRSGPACRASEPHQPLPNLRMRSICVP